MTETPPRITTNDDPGQRLRGWLSLAMLVLTLVLLAASLFLISPPDFEGYSGAIPWADGSILKRVTDAMSLGGTVATVRGVEIKDFAFHLASAVALALLAVRALISAFFPAARHTRKGAWLYAQAFLVGWVALALFSSRWSGDAELSLGQGLLYGLAVAWALSLAWTLESRDVPRLLYTYVVLAALAGACCVWYFHVRNPYHRPGFPIGNPGALAVVIAPAMLIAGAVLLEPVATALAGGRAVWTRIHVLCAVALIPLTWCFWLAAARSAMVGVIVGIAGVAFLRVRWRLRGFIAAALLCFASLAAWHLTHTMQDYAMQRGATVRFRAYAWKYAAMLWGQRPISGVGAGGYPRTASTLAVEDRVLDPAAFMGDMVEHAHNELFELLAEIGLVGGVTVVGGWLATLAAASAILRTNLSAKRRWLLYGLVAAAIAMAADAMLGASLRLPGTAAIFFTLVGAIWALGRSISKERLRLPVRDADVQWRAEMRRYALAVLAAVGVLQAGAMALRNWSGLQHEYRAELAQREGRHEAAIADGQIARAMLLDPVRKLIAEKRVVDSRFALATTAYGDVQRGLARVQQETLEGDARSELLEPLVQGAVDRCETAYGAAMQLGQRAPNFGRMPATCAQCAEMLGWLSAGMGDVPRSNGWKLQALQAWRAQLALRPFDNMTLLALTRHLGPGLQHSPQFVGEYLGFLRDALRNGRPSEHWFTALVAAEEVADIEPTLTAMKQSVGPFDPQTDVDTLILSRAPEMYRLCALWAVRHGQLAAAADDARHAAELYEPMRPRYPELYSVARAEQAEFTFQAQPDQPAVAVELAEEALDALPRIQAHKYADLAQPYRVQLLRYELAAGQVEEARAVAALLSADDAAVDDYLAGAYIELARQFIQRPVDQRPDVVAWLDAALAIRPADSRGWAWKLALALEAGDRAAVEQTLAAAEAAGVNEDELQRLRAVVQQQFPPESQPADVSDSESESPGE